MKVSTGRDPRRWTAHLWFTAGAWPLLILLGTAISLTKTPYYSLSHAAAVAAAAVGFALSVPDILLTGAAFFAAGIYIFKRYGVHEPGDPRDRLRKIAEPFVLFTATLAGIALWYPAILSEPLFLPLARLPAGFVVILLCAVVALGVYYTAMPGRRLRLAFVLTAVSLVTPGLVSARALAERHLGEPPNIVLLGIDSVSRADDLGTFQEWVGHRHGTWYEYAVGPGLLTNAVWTSILTMQPVSTHRVFHTFQNPHSESPPLIAAAHSAGYRTVSIFGNQLTCAVGSTAGFDEDRSGPIGWRQILLPTTANASFLLPLFRPLMPQIWPGPTVPNQSGTYSYDVRREIREILRAGSSDGRTLVAAHLTYPHLPAYPKSVELPWAAIWQIARAPAAEIRDRSFDWKDVDLPTDPIALRAWKVRNLFDAIAAEVEATGYLQRGGQLVVFSDHGARAGLTMENFSEPRYHHVVLATFGLRSRCPRAPISLTDMGSLLGFSQARAEPIVEYTNTPPSLWPKLASTAKIRWSGEVELDPTVLNQVFEGMRRHIPWQDTPRLPCDVHADDKDQ